MRHCVSSHWHCVLISDDKFVVFSLFSLFFAFNALANRFMIYHYCRHQCRVCWLGQICLLFFFWRSDELVCVCFALKIADAAVVSKSSAKPHHWIGEAKGLPKCTSTSRTRSLHLGSIQSTNCLSKWSDSLTRTVGKVCLTSSSPSFK